jgi:hypothetical protein
MRVRIAYLHFLDVFSFFYFAKNLFGFVFDLLSVNCFQRKAGSETVSDIS